MPWLFLFILTPIVEMYLLIQVGGYLGAWPTIALVMLTAVVGVYFLKRQGLATLTRGLQRMDAGQMPAREVTEGLLLAIAGALLLTPGFVTDVFGFMLLLPPARARIAGLMIDRMVVSGIGIGAAGVHGTRGQAHAGSERSGGYQNAGGPWRHSGRNPSGTDRTDRTDRADEAAGSRVFEGEFERHEDGAPGAGSSHGENSEDTRPSASATKIERDSRRD